jgi:hypothetical protein
LLRFADGLDNAWFALSPTAALTCSPTWTYTGFVPVRRSAAAPELIERWSLTSLRERLIETGARLVHHARYAVFQFAKAALPRKVFASVLGLINGLRGPPSEAACA